MPQDHNARNRNHYGDFSRLHLNPIDLIRDLSRLSRFSRTFLGAPAPALFDPAGLAPEFSSLSSLSSLSSHIFCASPEETDDMDCTPELRYDGRQLIRGNPST
jgi:hypothetical protein